MLTATITVITVLGDKFKFYSALGQNILNKNTFMFSYPTFRPILRSFSRNLKFYSFSIKYNALYVA